MIKNSTRCNRLVDGSPVPDGEGSNVISFTLKPTGNASEERRFSCTIFPDYNLNPRICDPDKSGRAIFGSFRNRKKGAQRSNPGRPHRTSLLSDYLEFTGECLIVTFWTGYFVTWCRESQPIPILFCPNIGFLNSNPTFRALCNFCQP